MKTIETRKAAGMVLAHDVTQIVPGEFKGARFKKGHVVAPEDIPVLLSMGKENLYVLSLAEDEVHEDEAAKRIAKSAGGKHTGFALKGEGKAELYAETRGIVRVDTQALEALLEDDAVMFASIHPGQLAEAGQVLAGTRVIPLFVKEQVVKTAEAVGTVIWIDPIQQKKVGIVTTGSEIYHGRIKDAFGPVLQEKFGALGCTVIEQLFSEDDTAMIAREIHALREQGAELIAVTGGMSVDPDDRTPAGIRAAGTEIVSYGAPVLPGAMFLLGYLGDIPVVGLPGCVMYHGASVFDLLVPRLLAGERVTKRDIKKLACGGLCRGCKACVYPNCGFGKGYSG